MKTTLHLSSQCPEETQNIGRALGQSSNPGDTFLLIGPLGAGKTCLVQGIAWGLGVVEYARSPTFVLNTRYQGRVPIYHADLYRIEDPQEAEDLGLDEYINGQGVCVVEWADRAPELFPDSCMWIELTYGETDLDRNLVISAEPQNATKLLDILNAQKS